MSPLVPQRQRPAANGGRRSASSAMTPEISRLGTGWPSARVTQSAQWASPGWSRRYSRTTLSVRLNAIA